jgi:hypothetical protein
MTECFELVYHGNGGFNWNDVWSMPVPHRRFNLKKIKEYLDRLESMRNEQRNVVTETSKIHKPAISRPSDGAYVSKVKNKK